MILPYKIFMYDCIVNLCTWLLKRDQETNC
jgi:hypothetical protein